MDASPKRKPAEEKALVKYAESSEEPVHDFNVLNHNFDLCASPINFMHRRTIWEELIYRAALAETQRKSPYASFRLALENSDILDKIGIVVGVRSLKSLLSMIFKDTPVSLTVHRVGNLILIDEFDVANFVLKTKESEWDFLRKILREKQFAVMKSQNQNEELFRKFLYHCLLNLERVQAAPVVPPDSALPAPAIREEERYCFDESPSQQQMPEEHARSIVWNLHQDMRLLVGSDLAIFGTPNHPCISLRLQDSNQPINVLTGIDLWLDNMLNEVAEVAMCYHSNGIVEQDFRIIRTDDLPRETGFETSEVKKYLKNVMEFLHRQKLREGRTYWLYKGDDIDVVKLYDLSDLRLVSSPEEDNSATEAPYPNPFTRPVATLCCTLAENRLARLRQWDEGSRQRDVFADKECFDELAKDALRLLWNCFQCVVPQKDLRLFVQAVQLYQELLQLMRAHGCHEPVLDSAHGFDPALAGRSHRIGPHRTAEAAGAAAALATGAVAVEGPRYEEVLIESLREAAVSNVVLCEASLRGLQEDPRKDLLGQVIEAMTAVLDRRHPSDYLHDRDSMPSANPRQSIPLQMEESRSWEEAALTSLRQSALTVALRSARTELEVEGDGPQALEAGRTALQWTRLAEFLHEFPPAEKQLMVDIFQLRTHCASLLMHCVQRVEMGRRMSVLSPAALTEDQQRLVQLCVTAAHPSAENHKALVATAEQRLSESLVCLGRLRTAAADLLKAVEAQKVDRLKGCMGHRGLAYSYIQVLLLYLQLAIRELAHKVDEHFQKNDFNANSYISTAVSLARKLDYRSEGAMCLLAQATLFKLAALRETGGNTRHVEAALKAYGKARDLIGSKHNSFNIWTEINRCRMRTVLEVVNLRGDNILEATKAELLASALDEKCQDDWGNPKLPSFKDQIRAKFELQALMIDINHKRFRRVISESPHLVRNFQFVCKKVCGMVSDATILQRQYFAWALSSEAVASNAICADMAAEAFLSILSTIEKVFSDVKSHISGFSSVISLLADFLARFHRQEPVLQLRRFEPFGASEGWRSAASGLCSFVQRATQQAAREKSAVKPKGAPAKQRKGAAKLAEGQQQQQQQEDLSEQLKDVYRQLLQLQLNSTNFALCLHDMCDLLLRHFEGKLV